MYFTQPIRMTLLRVYMFDKFMCRTAFLLFIKRIQQLIRDVLYSKACKNGHDLSRRIVLSIIGISALHTSYQGSFPHRWFSQTPNRRQYLGIIMKRYTKGTLVRQGERKCIKLVRLQHTTAQMTYKNVSNIQHTASKEWAYILLFQRAGYVSHCIIPVGRAYNLLHHYGSHMVKGSAYNLVHCDTSLHR